jgi:hypothetical protein
VQDLKQRYSKVHFSESNTLLEMKAELSETDGTRYKQRVASLEATARCEHYTQLSSHNEDHGEVSVEQKIP